MKYLCANKINVILELGNKPKIWVSLVNEDCVEVKATASKDLFNSKTFYEVM